MQQSHNSAAEINSTVSLLSGIEIHPQLKSVSQSVSSSMRGAPLGTRAFFCAAGAVCCSCFFRILQARKLHPRTDILDSRATLISTSFFAKSVCEFCL